MSKFRRLYDYVQSRGYIAPGNANLFQPETASVEDLAIAHDRDYLQGMLTNDLTKQVWRRIGLPWSQGLIDRTVTAPNGTLLTAEKALEHGMACHLAGGTHHAHRDFGSGFCILNDLAYAALRLVETGRARQILIFDCDVHQGDGTAAILHHHDHIFTCSIHCEKNFPFRKSDSDLDIGLASDISEDEYLNVVMRTFEQLIAVLSPDLVLYDAGVDVWAEDDLGLLDISWQGIEQRDYGILKTCQDRGIPVATVIGGGYDRDHERLARRHGIVVDQAYRLVG